MKSQGIRVAYLRLNNGLALALTLLALAVASQSSADEVQCLKELTSSECQNDENTCIANPTSLRPVNGTVLPGHSGWTALEIKCGKPPGLTTQVCGHPLSGNTCTGHGCDRPPIGIPPTVASDSVDKPHLANERTNRRAIQKVSPNPGINIQPSFWVGTQAQDQPALPILAEALEELGSYHVRASVEMLFADDSGEIGGRGSIEVWQLDDYYRWKSDTNLGSILTPDLDVAFGPGGYEAQQMGIVQIAKSDFRQVSSPLPNPLYMMLMPLAADKDCLHPNAMTICTMSEIRSMAGGESAEPFLMPDGQPAVEWFEMRKSDLRTLSAVRLVDFRSVGGLSLPHLIHIWEYDPNEPIWESDNWRSWVTIKIEAIRLNEQIPSKAFRPTSKAAGMPTYDLETASLVGDAE